jgi:Sulfotransferase family
MFIQYYTRQNYHCDNSTGNKNTAMKRRTSFIAILRFLVVLLVVNSIVFNSTIHLFVRILGSTTTESEDWLYGYKSCKENSTWGRTHGKTSERCKNPTFTDTPVHTDYDENDILLIHIGKAGGTSIRSLMSRASHQCDEYYVQDKTSKERDDPENWEDYKDLAHACAFSTITGEYTLVHMNRRHGSLDKSDHFLVPLRNPVDRLISWWNYETSFVKDDEPVRRSARLTFLMHCYKDVNSLITDGLQPYDQKIVSAQTHDYSSKRTDRKKRGQAFCRKLARECLTGEVPCYAHNFYGYEWYLENLLLSKGDFLVDNKDVLERFKGTLHYNKWIELKREIRIDVLRVEHDVNDLSRILQLWTNGLTPSSERAGSLLNQYSQKLPGGRETIAKNAKYVEPMGLQRLCQSICPELIVYKKILYHADNLSDDEVQESYDELDKRCGLNVDDVCGTDFYYRDLYRQKQIVICDPSVTSDQHGLRPIVVGGVHPPC